MLKNVSQMWAPLLAFLVAFLSGAFLSALLGASVALVLFAIGGATGAAYAFQLGPLLVFETITSPGELSLVFGPGFLIVVLLLGFFNASLSVILLKRKEK